MLKDWEFPCFVGILMGIALSFCASNCPTDGDLAELTLSVSNASITFSSVMIGVLVALFSLLQFVEDRPIVQKRLKGTEVWKVFKENLRRLLALLSFLLLAGMCGVGFAIGFRGKISLPPERLGCLAVAIVFILGLSVGMSATRLYKSMKTLLTVHQAAEDEIQ